MLTGNGTESSEGKTKKRLKPPITISVAARTIGESSQLSQNFNLYFSKNCDYLRQKVGESNTNKVNISKRPNNIAKPNIHFAVSLISL